MVDVVDTPCFVDSRYTMGIQLADLVAGVIRQYEQAELFSDPYPDDFYLRAIARYYSIVRRQDTGVDGPNRDIPLAWLAPYSQRGCTTSSPMRKRSVGPSLKTRVPRA